MGTGIKGFKSQKILKSKLTGYTESESIDTERYATIQEVPGDRFAVDVVSHGAFKVSLAPLVVAAGSNIRVIKAVAHGAVKGDIIKFLSTGVEAPVLSIPDANTIVLGMELSSDPTGLSFDVLRHVTPLYKSDGSVAVSGTFTVGPIQYNRTSGGITSSVEVTEDKDTPSNSRGLPVTIHSLDGAPINITAGDLNVQLSHTGANYDSTRIGDGINLLGVTASNEAKTSDADSHTKLDTLHTDNVTIEGKLDTLHSDNVTVEGKLDILHSDNVTVEGKIDTTNTKLDTLHSDLTTTNTDLSNIYTRQADGNQITKIKSGSNNNVVDVFTLATNPVGGDKGMLVQAITHGKLGSNYVDINATAAGALVVDNSGVTQPVSGSVSVSNFPATQNVAINGITEDRNSGAATANTLRTVLATRHETNTTPLALRESDGTNWLSSIALAAAQLTSGALTAIRMSASIIMGWDGTTHRELSVDNTGKLNVNAAVTQGYSSGTIYSTQKPVGTSAVRGTVAGTAPNSTRKAVMFKPSKNNTGAIYLGGSGVLTSTGLEIIGPDRLEFFNDINDWYLISDQLGQVVEIIEVF